MLVLNGVFAVFTASLYGSELARRKLLFWCILAGGRAQISYVFYNSIQDAYFIESL